ncbi:MAG: hypothetical protein ABL973_14610 [Micropepsaceae bacterium]
MSAFVVSISLATNAFAYQALDWSDAPILNDPNLTWEVQGRGINATATLGYPDSDHLIIKLTCSGHHKIIASKFDTEFEPISKYEIHIRANKIVRTLGGTTRENTEAEGVELTFTLPSDDKFLRSVSSGGKLSVLFGGPGRNYAGFTTKVPETVLRPFFKSCST